MKKIGFLKQSLIFMVVFAVLLASAFADAGQVTITPENPTQDDSITCTLNYLYDANGNKITPTGYDYSWVSDTRKTHVGSTVPSAKISAGESWTCTPFREMTSRYGTRIQMLSWLATTVRIASEPGISDPEVTVFGIFPSAPGDDDDLECRVEGSNLVGIEYMWMKNGYIQSGLISSIISSSLTSPGEEWTCQVTIPRSIGFIVREDSVFIGGAPITPPGPNSAPVLSGAEVNPAGGYEDTEFEFRVIYTDADDDAPDRVTLRIDGINYIMVRASGQDGDYTNGERYESRIEGLRAGAYTYTITANDGTADSNAVSGSFEVRRGTQSESARDEQPDYRNIYFGSSSYAEAGSFTRVSVTIENEMSGDIKDLKFTAYIHTLGVSASTGLFTVDRRDTRTVYVDLELPETAVSGVYEIKLELLGSAIDEVIYRSIYIRGVEAQSGIMEEPPQPPIKYEREERGAFPWLLLILMILLIGGILWLVYLLWGENIKESINQLYKKIKGTDKAEPVMLADSNAGFESTENSYRGSYY